MFVVHWQRHAFRTFIGTPRFAVHALTSWNLDLGASLDLGTWDLEL